MLRGFADFVVAGGGGLTLTGSADPGIAQSAVLSQVALLPDDCISSTSFPKDKVDVNGQQLDVRQRNTWVMKLDEIETPELAEVFL